MRALFITILAIFAAIAIGAVVLVSTGKIPLTTSHYQQSCPSGQVREGDTCAFNSP